MLADLRRVPPVFPSAGENARCGWVTCLPFFDVGPRTQCISGLNHAAYGLPVNVWVANYYSARNPLRLSSLVILGVVARMFRCATRSSCWCT